MDRLGGLVVIAPANPGPGENFSLKLLKSTCQMVILKAKIIYIYIYLFIYLLLYGTRALEEL